MTTQFLLQNATGNGAGTPLDINPSAASPKKKTVLVYGVFDGADVSVQVTDSAGNPHETGISGITDATTNEIFSAAVNFEASGFKMQATIANAGASTDLNAEVW